MERQEQETGILPSGGASPKWQVLRCFNCAPGWSVREILARLEENKTIKRGTPETYSWFETTIADVYDRCDGVAPAESEIQEILKPKIEPETAAKPAPGISDCRCDSTCPTCRDTGWINDQQKRAVCYCEAGNAVRRNRQEQRERELEAKRQHKRRTDQGTRFMAVAKRYSLDVRRRIEASDGLGGEFFAADLEEREGILAQLESGTHRVFQRAACQLNRLQTSHNEQTPKTIKDASFG